MPTLGRGVSFTYAHRLRARKLCAKKKRNASGVMSTRGEEVGKVAQEQNLKYIHTNSRPFSRGCGIVIFFETQRLFHVSNNEILGVGSHRFVQKRPTRLDRNRSAEPSIWQHHRKLCPPFLEKDLLHNYFSSPL